MMRSLDLGSGPNPKNIFNVDEVYGIDLRASSNPNVLCADLAVEPIPFPDEYFEYVTAHDFIEHIPRLLYVPHRRYAFVELMNEIWRVLKVNGVFMSLTPAFPHEQAWRDPTHVNMITETTWQLYFDEQNRWGKAYGFTGAFRITQHEWRGPHLLAMMQKILPPPAGEASN